MAPPLTVVDTTVIIDILRGFQPAIEWVESIERRLVASEVTRIEVLRGLRNHERRAAEHAIGALRWIAVDESIARRAGELGRRWRRSHSSLSLADLVIGSTAIEFGAELATSNVRHYPMFPHLRPPYAETTGAADTKQGDQRPPGQHSGERDVGMVVANVRRDPGCPLAVAIVKRGTGRSGEEQAGSSMSRGRR